MQKLLLWDLDGTLLQTGGVSAEAMHTAMTKVFGSAPRRERPFYSGKTDRQIIQETYALLTHADVLEQLSDFMTTYELELLARQDRLRAKAALMPGILTVLQALQPQTLQAPLTGNIAPIAQLKLAVLNLLPYFDVAVGAYGNDHFDRPALVPIALARVMQAYGRSFRGQTVVVIGDTPHDILCGKANGTRTVALATGAYSLQELQAHQPDAALPDATDLAATLAAILG